MARSTPGRSPGERSGERYTIRVYDRAQVAQLLGATVAQVAHWSAEGMIPSPYGHGATALWTAEDIETARAGLALPGTYLVARHPILRERIEALREAARQHRDAAPRSKPAQTGRRRSRAGKGGVV